MFRLILVALVLVIASPARAHLHLTADEPQASLVWWRPSVEGSLGVQVGNASAGAKYSDDHPSSFGATASLRTFGAVCLDLDYTPINTDAKVVSSAAFTFHDKTFSATGNGHLNYAMPVLGVGLRYLVLERKRGNLGVIGTVKVVMPNVKLSVGSATAAADLVIPVPMAGLSGQLNFGAWAHAFGSYKAPGHRRGGRAHRGLGDRPVRGPQPAGPDRLPRGRRLPQARHRHRHGGRRRPEALDAPRRPVPRARPRLLAHHIF